MSIITELLDVFELSGEILRAEDVIEFARNPETELHKHFTWDDTIAAHQYRLHEARKVIQVHVLMAEPNQMTVRAFVSLVEDRNIPGGGYRRIEDVLSDPERRQKFLVQALREANAWRDKYRALQELAPIFNAVDKVKATPILKMAPAEALSLVA